jgi:peptidoglycan/xylan/chitin deacetylase (PgdA/CDA1 family)
MKLKEWFSVRGPVFIRQRARSLITRYRFIPHKAMNRIDDCLNGLIDNNCAPTFPTPGLVVMRYPHFIRRLQDRGAEISVHGYQHVDLSAYSVSNACQQLVKAVEAYNRIGLDVHGFRCPYLGYTDELLDALPKGLFKYSSNKAIYWNFPQGIENGYANIVRDTLRNIYHAISSTDAISVPYFRPNMLEIPVSLPDDMELIDGLNLSGEEVAAAWCQILDSTYKRGELFTLLFHPELANLCEQPFYEVISRAILKRPQVWMSRLCDISDWWAEKDGFRLEFTSSWSGIRLNFICSPRATILVKGFDLGNSGEAWEGPYQRLNTHILEIPAYPRPFLGLSGKVSLKTIKFLTEQGYILDTTDTASRCSIFLDDAILDGLKSEFALINYLEDFSGPLVRYWRWPNGAKSALSITGDLDALSLFDYVSRLNKI